MNVSAISIETPKRQIINSSKTSSPMIRQSSIAHDNISFGHWYYKKIEVLDASQYALRKLAEYFHKSEDRHIVKATKVKGLIFNDSVKSAEAYHKLKSAIEKVIAEKKELTSTIAPLEAKAAKGVSNVTEQQSNIEKVFINFVKAEKEGADVPIDNGILIYGSSKEKKKFIKWIDSKTNVNYKEMTFDKAHPFESLEQLIQNAQNAETVFKLTRKRTLLNVKNLDNLLVGQDNQQGRKLLGKFKAFAERLSEDYHTTIITATNKPLKDFESAARARFGTQVYLKDGITASEKQELDSARAVVKRMDERAGKIDEYYYEVEDDYSHLSDPSCL